MTLVGSLGMLKKIGIQFMPSSNSNVLNVKLSMPVGSSADKTNEEALKFEKYLKERNDVENVASVVGDTSSSGSNVLSNQSSNATAFTVVLKENADVNKSMDELRTKAKEFNSNGESMTITPQSVTGTQADNVEVIINGRNLNDITKAAGLITDKLKSMDALSNVTNNISEKRPEISITVDPAKAADKGLNPAIASGLVRSFLGFNKITAISSSGSNNKSSSMDVMLGYQAKDLDSIDKIRNLELQGMGDPIKLGDIATIEQKDGPATISELNGSQYASVVADINGSNTLLLLLKKVASSSLHYTKANGTKLCKIS